MRKQKGITLVTLVITVMVLAILTGITVSSLVGDNGIISSTKESKENMEITKKEEDEKVNQLYEQLTGYDAQLNPDVGSEIEKIENELLSFKKAIANYIEAAGGVKPEYTAETELFGECIQGILQEVTKDATATEEDILAGKTAYVNGSLIMGTAPENGGEIEQELLYSYTNNSSTYVNTAQTYTFTEEYRSALCIISMARDTTDCTASSSVTDCVKTNLVSKAIHYNTVIRSVVILDLLTDIAVGTTYKVTPSLGYAYQIYIVGIK